MTKHPEEAEYNSKNRYVQEGSEQVHTEKSNSWVCQSDNPFSNTEALLIRNVVMLSLHTAFYPPIESGV